ncbi:MAG: tyrosine-protein phosphatase [Sarcina sp.]
MIDLHSHIIPRIDDGAKDKEISLQMLKRAEESGTKKIVLTPHFFRGKYMEPLKVVKEYVEQMKEFAYKNDINIELYHGQEVYVTENLLEDLENGEIGTINDTKYMLVELDLVKIEDFVLDMIYELSIRNIIPVIAHPERYLEFQKHPSKINKFIDEGCLFQLNAGSIGGLLGKESQKLAKTYLENGLYSFIGSDAHSDGQRNTDIQQYVNDIEQVDPSFIKTSIENAEKLLKDEKVKFTGKRIERREKKKKGIFSFFKR